MQYLKVSFTITPVNEINRDILTAYLAGLDFDSFEETPSGIDAYIPREKMNSAQTGEVIAMLPFQTYFTSEEMPDINWNEEWEKNYFQPLLIGRDCLVRAPFHKEYPKTAYEIIIEPNMAFGTGNHETTTMMAEYLLELDVIGADILDMGCGTGILGILAGKKQCNSVTAVDIDSWAIESAIRNAALNGMHNMETMIGNVNVLDGRQFNIVLANIQKNVIINDMGHYAAALKNDGLLIVSGFYRDDIEDIIGRAAECFLTKMMIKEKNNWAAILFSA